MAVHDCFVRDTAVDGDEREVVGTFSKSFGGQRVAAGGEASLDRGPADAALRAHVEDDRRRAGQVVGVPADPDLAGPAGEPVLRGAAWCDGGGGDLSEPADLLGFETRTCDGCEETPGPCAGRIDDDRACAPVGAALRRGIAVAPADAVVAPAGRHEREAAGSGAVTLDDEERPAGFEVDLDRLANAAAPAAADVVMVTNRSTSEPMLSILGGKLVTSFQ